MLVRRRRRDRPFLRRLASYDALESGRLLAERAAWSVARTTRWTEPIQCHGLAGNAELLIDAYAATGDVAYLREASSLAELLEDAVTVHIEGNGEHSYLSGSAGLLTTLVRLADPRTAGTRSDQTYSRREGSALTGKRVRCLRCPAPGRRPSSTSRSTGRFLRKRALDCRPSVVIMAEEVGRPRRLRGRTSTLERGAA